MQTPTEVLTTLAQVLTTPSQVLTTPSQVLTTPTQVLLMLRLVLVISTLLSSSMSKQTMPLLETLYQFTFVEDAIKFSNY